MLVLVAVLPGGCAFGGKKSATPDREAVVTFIRRLYLAGVKDPKRLTFKGLQALTRA